MGQAEWLRVSTVKSRIFLLQRALTDRSLLCRLPVSFSDATLPPVDFGGMVVTLLPCSIGWIFRLPPRNQNGLPACSLAPGAWDYGQVSRYSIRDKGHAGIVYWACIAATMLRHNNALFLRTSSNSHYSDDYVIDRYRVNIAGPFSPG